MKSRMEFLVEERCMPASRRAHLSPHGLTEEIGRRGVRLWDGSVRAGTRSLQRDLYVLDFLPLPGVGNVNLAIRSLYHRRIGILACLGFQRPPGSPMFAIVAECQVQRSTAASGVVVYREVATVLQPDHIDA